MSSLWVMTQTASVQLLMKIMWYDQKLNGPFAKSLCASIAKWNHILLSLVLPEKKIHRFPTCEQPCLQGLNTPDFPEGLKRKTKQRDVHCEQTHFLLPKWLRYKQMEIVPGITKWIGLIVLVTSLPSVLPLLLPGETSHTCVKRVLVSIPSGRQKDISVLTLLSRFSGFFL